MQRVQECSGAVRRELTLRRISISTSTSLSLQSFFSVFYSGPLPVSTARQPPSIPTSWFPLRSLVFISLSSSSVLEGPSEEDEVCSLYGNVPHGALLQLLTPQR